MSRDRFDVLERFASLFPPPERPYDGLLRRRERKQRNERFAAGVVGLVIAIAVAVGGAALLRSEPRPADRQSTLPPVLHKGEVLDPVDENGPTGHLDAFDPSTGARRTLVKCTDPCAYFDEIALSPDGRWLAYEISTCGGGGLGCEPQAGIWVTNALGERRQLTQPSDVWAWAPQGATLAVDEAGDAPGLFTIDPATGNRTKVATPRSDPSALAWAPDGSRLAFATDTLSVVDLATGASTVLVDQVGDTHRIDWSPDGTRLVFDPFRGDRYQIVVVNADGTDERVLVDEGGPQVPGAPAWSPDGTRIAYASTRREDVTYPFGLPLSLEVWVIGADGSGPTRVFHGECCIGDSKGPVWSPDGERIAFWDDADLGFTDTWFAVNADGTGRPQAIPEFETQGW